MTTLFTALQEFAHPLHRYYEAVRPSPAHRYFRPRGWNHYVVFGEQRTCAAEARGPHLKRMTRNGHRPISFLR